MKFLKQQLELISKFTKISEYKISKKEEWE